MEASQTVQTMRPHIPHSMLFALNSQILINILIKSIVKPINNHDLWVILQD